MKDILKLVAIIVPAITAALLPLWGAIHVWHWMIAQVPVTNAYAGLIKVVITFGCIAIGGGATVGLGIFVGILVGGVLAAIFAS